MDPPPSATFDLRLDMDLNPSGIFGNLKRNSFRRTPTFYLGSVTSESQISAVSGSDPERPDAPLTLQSEALQLLEASRGEQEGNPRVFSC